MIAAIASALMALLIVARVAQVLNDTSFRTRDRHYAAWELFTLGYCVLGAAAACTAFLIGVGRGHWVMWIWLAASDALIISEWLKRPAP